ncbi:MAG TPA: molecular chaperone SurA [Gammaproteobacteria bacterium]|nr:molecular chaperone SurA [Gammaproteobacteria bacterium]
MPLFAAAVTLGLFSPSSSAATRFTLERIVAVVNDDVITRTELEERVRIIRQQLMDRRTPMPPDAILKRQVLERMIIASLELQLAAKVGIRVDDVMLNRALKQIAAQNNLTLARFREVLEEDGFDFAQFREDIRKELITNRLRQRQVRDRTTVTEQEIDTFLANQRAQGKGNEEYHLGHILIAVPETADADTLRAARAKAEAVVAGLRAGADFERMAITRSDGRQALEGGDLGWRKAAEIPSLFVEPLDRMAPGDISDPIRSPSGYHIIKLLDRRTSERHLVTQTLARHILIRPSELHPEAEVEMELSRLRERILAGEDFGALAREYSQDPKSAAEDGSLGWVKPGDLVPPFEAAMNRIAEGEISPPFQTNFGWHIVQVEQRRRIDDTDRFIRQQARRQILERKVEEATEAWLHRLRDEAYVENRLDSAPS